MTAGTEIEQLWRIMVVDDEDDARKLIRMSLGSQYEVVEAKNGLDALERIEDVEPDLVIMDVMMPLMDGFQTTEKIRNIPKYQTLTVMFLSAKSDSESIRKGYESGANLYLTKPCEPIRLLKNVDVFFEHSPPPKYVKRHTLQLLEQFEEDRRKLEQEIKEGRFPNPHKHQTPTPQKPATPVKTAEPEKLEIPPPTIQGSLEEVEEEIFVDEPKPEPIITPPPRPVAPKPDTSTERERVMIIDPDPEVVDYITETLEDTFEIIEAESGFNAIERIVHYEPDLIMLDAMMPNLSAFQLCQMLRKSSKFITVPIIIMSSRASQKDQQHAKQLGASQFLSKPLEADKLKINVTDLIKAAPPSRFKKKLTITEIREREEEIMLKKADREKRNQLKEDDNALRKIIREEEQ